MESELFGNPGIGLLFDEAGPQSFVLFRWPMDGVEEELGDLFVDICPYRSLLVTPIQYKESHQSSTRAYGHYDR